MSLSTGGSMSAASSLSEISDMETLKLGLDLVSAARRNIGFLRTVAESQWLHQKATAVEAVRRSTFGSGVSVK